MGTEVKLMKAIFVIAIAFACSVCEVTSLKCYQCSFIHEDVPNCDSPEKVRSPEEMKFCVKIEYAWFLSLFVSEPPGHYIGKDYADNTICTANGYYRYLGAWVTCCQGDYCN